MHYKSGAYVYTCCKMISELDAKLICVINLSK